MENVHARQSLEQFGGKFETFELFFFAESVQTFYHFYENNHNNMKL